jgi:hypothetical protein
MRHGVLLRDVASFVLAVLANTTGALIAHWLLK